MLVAVKLQNFTCQGGSLVELALLVDISKVDAKALLIARHGDLQHPGGGVEPLGGPLHPRH